MKKRYWLLCGLILFGISKLGETPSGYGVTAPSPSSSGVTYASKPEPPTVTSGQSTIPPANNTVTPPSETTKPHSTQTSRTKFASGNGVALRAAPGPKAQIIDRLDRGKKVDLLQTEGQWSRIKDVLTQKEGWVASRFLRDDAPKREQIAKPSEPTIKSAPTISPTIIIQRIIAESVTSYPGTCACPYSTDRRGRRCGNRSAYSKPGGYAPICFAQDVTKSMIEAYR